MSGSLIKDFFTSNHLSQGRPISFCLSVLMIDRSFCVMRVERVYTLLVLGSYGLLDGFLQIYKA